MFGKRTNPNALPIPAAAEADRSAVEVLRVWAAPGKPQQFILTQRRTLRVRPTWPTTVERIEQLKCEFVTS